MKSKGRWPRRDGLRLSIERRWLGAVMANPKDVETRLVYADWLEERGDPRAEFLRASLELEGLATDDARRAAELRARLDELTPQISGRWLAALKGPVWRPAGNVVSERPYGPGGAEVRRGTSQFSARTKVYYLSAYWGTGAEQITVVGRHRGSKRWIELVMRRSFVTDWRPALVYDPAVLEVLQDRPPLRVEPFASREEVAAFLRSTRWT